MALPDLRPESDRPPAMVILAAVKQGGLYILTGPFRRQQYYYQRYVCRSVDLVRSIIKHQSLGAFHSLCPCENWRLRPSFFRQTAHSRIIMHRRFCGAPHASVCSSV